MNFHLNTEGAGDAIAIIKTTRKATGKKYEPLVCIGEGSRSNFEEIKLNKDEIFIPVPNINKSRDVNYIFGQSGSGKSYWVMQYAKQYKKMYPRRSIYIFSTLDSDPEGLDKIGKINRIKLDDEFINAEMVDTKEFENSLVIFDDVDNVPEKKTKKIIWSYMNNFLQVGRHFNISLAITFHVSCNGNDTKMILNEATSISFFS